MSASTARARSTVSTKCGALREHLIAHDTRPGEIVDGSPGPDQEPRIEDPDGYCSMIAHRTENPTS